MSNNSDWMYVPLLSVKIKRKNLNFMHLFPDVTGICEIYISPHVDR